jgi:hypothetical protein
MKDIVNTDRVSQLKALLEILADAIDSRPGARDLASLSKQYRETLAEIEALEGNAPKDDQIEELLKNRKANGKSNAVRKNRAAVQRE